MPAKSVSTADAPRRHFGQWGMIVLTAGAGGVIVGALLFAWRHRDGETIEIRIEDDDTISVMGKRLANVKPPIVPVPAVAITPPVPKPVPTTDRITARPVVGRHELRLPRVTTWSIASRGVLWAIRDDVRLFRGWLRDWLQGSRRRISP